MRNNFVRGQRATSDNNWTRKCCFTSKGRGRAGAYPSYHRAGGGVHPELVASQSQGTYKQTTIRTYGQFRVFNQPTVHVFGTCEETGVPRENPRRHGENMRTPHRRGRNLNPSPQNSFRGEEEEKEVPPPPCVKEEEEDPECPHVKEEEEVLDVSELPLTVVVVKSKDDEDEAPEWSQLHHSSASGGKCGALPADNLVAPLSQSEDIEEAFRNDADKHLKTSGKKTTDLDQKPFNCSVCGCNFQMPEAATFICSNNYTQANGNVQLSYRSEGDGFGVQERNVLCLRIRIIFIWQKGK
ncbi:uncharacterized protein LOC133474775 isoform X5 [Phyllopteryx taeniolatus]|uniref:uncharacterized protein LOC133474775 isoform X5 n=1 Tax=Phyllopteryx taeniolatus TaxID=161469 RepID=UPI002AD1D80B|nr:uncharacterized protein LOC133474775 isoform X5 [Phyllopteryx taeniolatus]